MHSSARIAGHAPVAQLDRALASGARGRGFKSRREYQSSALHDTTAGVSGQPARIPTLAELLELRELERLAARYRMVTRRRAGTTELADDESVMAALRRTGRLEQ